LENTWIFFFSFRFGRLLSVKKDKKENATINKNTYFKSRYSINVADISAHTTYARLKDEKNKANSDQDLFLCTR